MDAVKICECGCGEPAAIAAYTIKQRGHVKGQPMRFARGHNPKREKSSSWKGGRLVKTNGYACVLRPQHPLADSKGYVYEHIVIAEKAYGGSLPLGVEVHHVNESKADNANTNLVICQNHAYHALLHYRAKALRETGNANLKQCRVCKVWSDHSIEKIDKVLAHRSCYKVQQREREARRPPRCHVRH